MFEAIKWINHDSTSHSEDVPTSMMFNKKKKKNIYIYIYTLEVQRLFFEWFFRKDYCFSRDLQSTIQGDYSFYGLGLPGYIYIYIWYPVNLRSFTENAQHSRGDKNQAPVISTESVHESWRCKQHVSMEGRDATSFHIFSRSTWCFFRVQMIYFRGVSVYLIFSCISIVMLNNSSSCGKTCLPSHVVFFSQKFPKHVLIYLYQK